MQNLTNYTLHNRDHMAFHGALPALLFRVWDFVLLGLRSLLYAHRVIDTQPKTCDSPGMRNVGSASDGNVWTPRRPEIASRTKGPGTK